jgi:hypothetical protein
MGLLEMNWAEKRRRSRQMGKLAELMTGMNDGRWKEKEEEEEEEEENVKLKTEEQEEEAEEVEEEEEAEDICGRRDLNLPSKEKI